MRKICAGKTLADVQLVPSSFLIVIVASAKLKHDVRHPITGF